MRNLNNGLIIGLVFVLLGDGIILATLLNRRENTSSVGIRPKTTAQLIAQNVNREE